MDNEIDLFQQHNTTIKELADLWKINEITIRRAIKEIMPEIIINGKTTYITEIQTAILKDFILENKRIDLDFKVEVTTESDEMLIVAKAYQILLKKVKEYENKIKIDVPKVEAFETFIDMKDLKSMKQVSELLNIGRNKLFKFLRTFKILDKKNEPYRKFIEMGLFEVKIKSITGINENLTVTYVTPKGIEYIRKQVKEFYL